MATFLFACPANATLSPLAEGIARHLAPEHEHWSAGPRPTHVRPEVRRVLEEMGMDSRDLRARGYVEVPVEEADVVVLLGAAVRRPPVPPGTHVEEWVLPDPASAPDEDRLEAFRASRDELLRRLEGLLRSRSAPGR